jgi:hypothetical protein
MSRSSSGCAGQAVKAAPARFAPPRLRRGAEHFETAYRLGIDEAAVWEMVRTIGLSPAALAALVLRESAVALGDIERARLRR